MNKNIMDRDVAIIGGSAAGFLTGTLLSRKGSRVRIFEAAEQLNHARRTLIVTNRMRKILGSVGERAVMNEIHQFELFADGKVASFKLNNPDLIIERSTLIHDLAMEAKRSGVKMRFGRRFINLEPNGRGLNFTVEQGRNGKREKNSADIIMGADGAFSKVGHAAGWPQQPTVPLMQVVVELPKDLPPDTTRIWFLPEDTRYFYWLIPESPTRGALGVIGENGKEMREKMLRFLKNKGLKPIEFQGARIPCYTSWIPNHKKIGGGDVYLVGDAAGHVKVSTVGGIVTGLRGAIGVVEAVTNGGTSRELSALRRELNLHLLIRKILHGFTQTDYARLLTLLNRRTRRSLGLFTRDETPKLLRNILLTQPRFILLGLRYLLTGSSFPNGSVQD